jgi:hypothetical protein
VTLLNPDYGLRDFLSGAGAVLRELCPVVTIYGDRNDGAHMSRDRRWDASQSLLTYVAA